MTLPIAFRRLALLAAFNFFQQAPSYAQGAVRELCAEYAAADKKLNDTYNEILTKRKRDPLFVAKLKKSQRAWLAFRDAELEALYPAKDKKAEYGSVYSSCRCSDETRLVEDRIKQLEGWIKVPEEGEVCRGSRT